MATHCHTNESVCTALSDALSFPERSLLWGSEHKLDAPSHSDSKFCYTLFLPQVG